MSTIALPLYDRVQETTTTTGNGTLTLAGAVTNRLAFSAVLADGQSTYYVIDDSTNNVWEIGIGTFTASGTKLSRDTILRNSSGTTSALTLSAGTKNVFIDVPAYQLNQLQTLGQTYALVRGAAINV